MTNMNFPPAGYIEGPSKVAGIQVYLPAPETNKRPDVVDFKCPKCGATTSYSVDAGKLYCEHCGYTEDLNAKKLGRAAEQFEFKVETLEQSEQGWGIERKEMACQNCGALVSIPPETLSYACPFCGSNKVLFREELQNVLRPRYLIPFKVNPQSCREITREWLGSSWMIPAQLRTAAHVDKFNPIYIPYWTFNALCKAQWKAQVGREVTEHYTVNGEQHTRTHIEWSWKSGAVERAFSDLLVPGTNRLNLSIMGKIDGYNIADLILYEPKYLAGIQAQAYDLHLEQAWDAGRQVMREQTRQTCRDRINSSHVRDFSA